MNPGVLPLVGNHLWQSTLFAALAGSLTFAFRQNRARVRHAIWMAASLKFLIPFSLLIALGGQLAWRAAPSAAGVGGLHSQFALYEISQPFTSLAAPYAPMPLPAAPARLPLLPIALLLWMCGFLGIVLSWRMRWRRIRAEVGAAAPLPLALPIRAVLSSGRMEPGVFGVLRPILVMPRDLMASLSPAQLDAVIAHELCHARNRDNLSAAVQMFVESVFWFYPPVWWIGKRMIAERERACDEAALEAGNAPRVYAEAVLRVCRLCIESPLASVAGISGADLKRRIEAIMNHRNGRNLTAGKKVLLGSACVAAVAVPLFAGLAAAPRALPRRRPRRRHSRS